MQTAACELDRLFSLSLGTFGNMSLLKWEDVLCRASANIISVPALSIKCFSLYLLCKSVCNSKGVKSLMFGFGGIRVLVSKLVCNYFHPSCSGFFATDFEKRFCFPDMFGLTRVSFLS